MGCRITGKGKSHYGDYDIVGTLSRSQDGDNYAKIRFTKYKPAVPWYYNACDVCGAEDPVDTLLLCDGQDGTCKNTCDRSAFFFSDSLIPELQGKR